MNLSLHVTGARCRPFIALGVLLFLLYDTLRANPVSTSAAAYVTTADCTPPGATASVSSTLTCINTSVTLQGSSPASGVIYTWSGPGGFASMLQNPSITLPGQYTLTVTRSSDGCTSTATVNVVQNIALPGATASVTGMLNCATPQVALTATTSIANATFLWLNSGGFSATTQSTTVNIAGGYTLTVTNPANGCTSTDAVVVDEDIEIPGVAAYVSGTLTCNDLLVDLEASSPTGNATFAWSGPNNFSSTLETPQVSAPGIYSVTAKNPDNQCTSTASVTVNQNIVQPGATATVAGELTCKVISTKLSASSPTADVTYSWTGPAGFSPTIVQNPTATKGGTYELTITKVSNGCKSIASVNVLQDITRPGASADSSGQLNCLVSEVSLLASSSLPTATYKWIGPSGFSSTDQNPVISAPGGYTLTATNPDNGCTSTNVTRVTRNIVVPAAVTASASGPLNCLINTVTLTATSTTPGVTYSWSGPGTITDANQAVASVTTPGIYTVTVTNPVNGCTTTTTVTVTQSVDVPADVTTTVSGPLTCTTTSVTLNGSSTTSGVTYLWTGPGVIANPTLAEISVSIPGTYTLTVKNPVNGCEIVKTITVIQDIVAPADVTATASDILTCITRSVTLTGSSSTTGMNYSWSGPGTITNANQAEASVTTPGIYTLTVTNPVNGCVSTKTVEVFENIIVPANLTATASGIITCAAPSITLSVNSSTPALTYSWSGPNSFTSTAQHPVVIAPGNYTVTATNTVNGCIATASVNVLEDKVAPGVVASVTPGTITCNAQEATLAATSNAVGIIYNWSGPDNYSSSEQNPKTTVGGLYTVVVTNPLNGCTSSSMVNVLQNSTRPADVAATVSGIINCLETSVILTGESSTAGVTYRWTGPNGFTSVQREPETDTEGVYLLTVTNPVNGCKTTANVTVEKNTVAPEGVAATTPGTLTCTTPSLTLNGTSTTPGVTYSWTGPGTIIDPASATPTVSAPGLYELTVKNMQNNCITTASVLVEQNATVPAAVTATASGLITCLTTHVQVTGNSTTSGVTYSWQGPNGFQSNEKSFPTNVPGTYTVTVKHTISGCTETASVLVEEDRTVPAAVTATVSDAITCTVNSVTLTGASSSSGVTYSWSGPGTISNPASASPSVSMAGTYTVTATHPVSGCTATATVNVMENKTQPSVTATTNGSITCTTSSVILTGASSTSGVTYSWSGPGTIANPSAATQTVSISGTYTVTVTHPVSGCTAMAAVTVQENKVNPGASASVSGPITCAANSVNLIAGSGTSGVTYSWTGTGTITNPTLAIASVSSTGTYTVKVTDPVNGCFSTAQATVAQNITPPNAGTIIASSGFILTCYTNTTTLSCSSTTSGATFKWTNSSGAVLSETTSVAVSSADTYTFTVTNPVNGCTTSRSRAITQNRISPTVTISPSSEITCANLAVTLTGTSSGSPVTYNWTGSGPITTLTTGTNTTTASVTTAGIYTLTVTTPSGCTAAASVTVNENKAKPANVAIDVSGDICGETMSVVLDGSSTTSGVSYQWTGPLESTDSNLETTVAGEYTLTVTNPSNGCAEVASVIVEPCGNLNGRKASPATIVAETLKTGVSLYPNPVKSIGTLEFTPQYDGPVQLELYTTANVKLSTVQGEEAKAGKVCTIAFDTEAYASGVYFYRLKVGPAEIKTGRMMIVH